MLGVCRTSLVSPRLACFRQHGRDMTHTSNLNWKLPSKQGYNGPWQSWDHYSWCLELGKSRMSGNMTHLEQTALVCHRHR